MQYFGEFHLNNRAAWLTLDVCQQVHVVWVLHVIVLERVGEYSFASPKSLLLGSYFVTRVSLLVIKAGQFR